MHPTSTTSTTTNSNNVGQYFPSPPVSTLRRASRPSNINLSIFDSNHNQQSNDPGIYSAPIYYVKPSNHQQQQQTHIPQPSQPPYTASFQYQQHPMQIPNLSIYQQQQQQQQQHQQQQLLMDQYSQHTPHTFPLQASPNHYQQYFYFPPSNVQLDITATNNNHQQQSTVPQNDRLRVVQRQWSNPVLSPLMVKRINENAASMVIDDDEDPSASIDALVADVDSTSEDLVDDQTNKTLDQTKNSSTTPAPTISPSPHMYLRGTSHILTTPPNPLASNDHPDNQLTVNANFQKTFSPIPSAGFELTNSNVQLSASNNTNTNTSYFTFDTNQSDQTEFKSTTTQNDTIETNLKKSSIIINTDIRTTTKITDDNSNHSSTNSNGQHSKSRIFSQMLSNSDQQRTSPSELNSNSTNPNRHCCTHPDCNKIFANKSALAKHKLTHSQDRKHKCSKCNKGFKRLDHLHGHMLTHEEEKPHKCRVPTCNRTYCDARSLKRHIENTHQDILAGIHDGTHSEYRKYLPTTAIVKTKDLTINSDFSIDSIDSNSPHSIGDNEQSFNIRTTTGAKVLTTYTYDEEKCVECHICKKPFKNGAALNGHMRLHGGFNEKQPSPQSGESTQPKKKQSNPKRKRTESPMVIKHEEQEMPMMDNFYPTQLNNLQQYSSVRSRSTSSTVPSRTYSNGNIQKPLSVQSTVNSQLYNEEKYKKSLSPETFLVNQHMNGHPSPPMYNNNPMARQPQQSSYYPSTANPMNLVQQSLFNKLLRGQTRMLYPDVNNYQPPQLEDFHRYTPSPSFTHSPLQMTNTPVPSPYASHASPVSNLPHNSMESTTTTTTAAPSSYSSSNIVLKKRILNSIEHESEENKINPLPNHETNATLTIVPDVDSPTKKSLSGFLIGTPSSTGASSSSSTSSQTHFNYDNVPTETKRESTPSSFQWPSQFRRQLSLNVPYQTSNPIPTTPYTPPPMLSPFRKGEGLYYRVFSQPGPTSSETPSIPTTPVAEESTNPKINVGPEYQANIPEYRPTRYRQPDNESTQDELLFSPHDLPELDEKALELFEKLNRSNPNLFASRTNQTSYSIELVYMLLYEYNGNLQRTLAALLEGTANDIKQCRPIHRYRFPECDIWTPTEIDAYTKNIQNTDKNLEAVSRDVGTKTVKQCIQFHYMPKVNLTSRKIYPIGTSSVVTRRKRVQLDKAKYQFDDDASSSSPFNDLRFDEDSDSTSSAQHNSCDTNDYSRGFTSERAHRAYRHEQRRNASTKRK